MEKMQKFDGILAQIVQDQQGYEGFFEVVFGFLQRKTDFYANSKMAEKICFEKANKYLQLYKQKKQDDQKQEEARAQRMKQKQEAKQQPKAETKKPEKPAQKTSVQETKEEEKKEEDKVEEGKIMPNKGNGSQTDTYYWTQTLEEITVVIPIEKNQRAKLLDVKLTMDKLYVAKKDKSVVYVDGEWPEKVSIDDSTWTVSEEKDRKVIEILVSKWKNTMLWWDCLIKGETPIDTKKINPEPSKLSDLDGEMKSTVGKMMFDMRQKQQGLPSSDELQKQEKLQAFMKANPQFDFSKAKISQL